MNDSHVLQIIRRNTLVGMWAAEKLGLTGESATAYARNLAMGALNPGHSNVLSKVRDDFKAAGVVQSDEQILGIMNQSWLEAQSGTATSRADASDPAAVQIARNLQTRANRS